MQKSTKKITSWRHNRDVKINIVTQITFIFNENFLLPLKMPFFHSSRSHSQDTVERFFDLKCTKIAGGWGSAPDPTGEAYSAPPDPLAVRGEGRGKEGRGGERRGGDFAILPPTSTSWLRHCSCILYIAFVLPVRLSRHWIKIIYYNYYYHYYYYYYTEVFCRFDANELYLN